MPVDESIELDDQRLAAELDAARRQLALVDRMLGLEARNAELAIATRLTPSEQLAVEARLERMRSSASWRVGRVITAPVRMLRRRLGR